MLMKDIWVQRAKGKCPNHFIWGLNKQRWLKAEGWGTEEEIAEEPGLALQSQGKYIFLPCSTMLP